MSNNLLPLWKTHVAYIPHAHSSTLKAFDERYQDEVNEAFACIKDAFLYSDFVEFSDLGLLDLMTGPFKEAGAPESAEWRSIRARSVYQRIAFNREVVSAGLANIFLPFQSMPKIFGDTSAFQDEVSQKAHIPSRQEYRAPNVVVNVGQANFINTLPGRWESYGATHTLLGALQKVLLPDVAELPLAAIAEMREQLV